MSKNSIRKLGPKNVENLLLGEEMRLQFAHSIRAVDEALHIYQMAKTAGKRVTKEGDPVSTQGFKTMPTGGQVFLPIGEIFRCISEEICTGTRLAFPIEE